MLNHFLHIEIVYYTYYNKHCNFDRIQIPCVVDSSDLLVGAPYEGQGAVYLYLGSPDGLSTQFSQRISPEDLPLHYTRPLKAFGISISRGVDVDNNLYPGTIIT